MLTTFNLKLLIKKYNFYFGKLWSKMFINISYIMFLVNFLYQEFRWYLSLFALKCSLMKDLLVSSEIVKKNFFSL